MATILPLDTQQVHLSTMSPSITASSAVAAKA
jgi:hypothetical protein